MNLNRQGRLFEMGMLPVFKTVPGHEKWSRVYSRPTWQASFIFWNFDSRILKQKLFLRIMKIIFKCHFVFIYLIKDLQLLILHFAIHSLTKIVKLNCLDTIKNLNIVKIYLLHGIYLSLIVFLLKLIINLISVIPMQFTIIVNYFAIR